MGKKAKGLGYLKRSLIKMMGRSGSEAFFSFLLPREKNDPFSFPVDTKSVKEIIVILPCTPLEVLYQLRNLVSIVSVFSHAGVTIFSERSVSSYIRMIPGLNVVEFDDEERWGFSSSFFSRMKEYSGRADLCILLDRTPDLAFLYLIGISEAPVRAGYFEAGRHPFLNIRVISDDSNTYLPERNLTMARLFGAKPLKIRWSVARKTSDELDQLFKEMKVSREDNLVGVDAQFFIRRFGKEWTGLLLERLKNLNEGKTYLYFDDSLEDTEIEWLNGQPFPVVTELPISRTAALVSSSKVLITGNSVLYALASVMGTPGVGFFRDEEIKIYCPQTSTLKGILYDEIAGKGSVDEVIGFVTQFIAGQ
jgi:ADP-heptose:LPS heptosyltransferase